MFAAPTSTPNPTPTPIPIPTPIPTDPGKAPPASVEPPTRARLLATMKRCAGNVSAAARDLGVHRTQLRRWLERHGIDAAALSPTGAIDDAD